MSSFFSEIKSSGNHLTGTKSIKNEFLLHNGRCCSSADLLVDTVEIHGVPGAIFIKTFKSKSFK